MDDDGANPGRREGLAAPGWYEDPLDAANVRYWDGGAWTAHVNVLEHPSALGRLAPPERPAAGAAPIALA